MYLKKLGLITIALLWAFKLTAAEEKVLNVYNWSDYIGEETLKNSPRRPESKSIMMCMTRMRPLKQN